MPKIIHHFFSLTFFLMLCVSSAFGAGYTCPTNRKYTTCNEGYYLAHSYTGTSYDSIKWDSTPRAGNACRPCTDYDNHYNRPEGSYYCEGKTKAPVLTTVRIIYNLNGGSGTTPDDETCKKGQPCTLNDGATTTFYRAGYVFKGWALTSDATSGFTSYTFTVVDVVYAVWEPCGIGKYKPGSGTQAAAACSSCPELTPGFEYFPATTNASLTACRQGITKAEEANEYCDAPSVTTELFDIQCYATSDGTWGDCAIGNVWGAKPGSYVGIWKQTMPAEDVIENMCIPCGVGTYSEGGQINSCSQCPELTPGFEYAPLTRLTSINNCSQVNYDISLINNNCTSLPGLESRPKITMRASAETGDWATYAVSPTEGAVYAVPGAYVNPDMMTNGEYLDIAGFDASNLCVACTVGTFSPGGDVHSCSACPSGTYSDAPGAYECTACPKLTPGFEYVPTTGNTSLTACKQGLKNPADINEFCEAASGTTAEELKIQCWAASDGTWGDCIRTGFPFDAKPGCYVGIPSQSQSMPVEDVVENICIQCTDGTYSEGGGATSCSACPALTTADERDGWKISTGGDGATSPQDCYAYLESYPTNCASGSFKRMLMGGGTGYYGSQWFELETLTANPGYRVDFEDGQTDAPACVECSAGTYSPGGDVHLCSACPTGYDDNPETGLTSADMCQISCPGGYYLAAANDATCSEVSPGYWAAEKIVNYGDTSTRTECASGLTTIGYGAGADEAADCGRVLHFGDDTLYLRSVKKTDHALHVGINGDVFYGNMGTDLSKGSLRIKLGDTTYSVYDDSM